MKATFKKYTLQFKVPSGTSRGVLKTKNTYFLKVSNQKTTGIGECGLFRGLSIDDRLDYEEQLSWVCNHIDLGEEPLLEACTEFPSIQIGIETAFRSLQSNDSFELFPSKFTSSEKTISINGLIWMGSKEFMKTQIADKLSQGFSCLKMKIGAIDFKTELQLLKSIRKEFSASDIELRVDANGAFVYTEALDKLKYLSELEIHSIEQPIKPRQWNEMAVLCEKSPLPVALDEELIGVFSEEKRKELLQTINPQYIILKPSLIGGFRGCDTWIDLAKKNNISWWITSALESNIGLNAIAQYTFTKNSTLPQGLGTGSLFVNNFVSPLEVRNGTLSYHINKAWDINNLKFD